MVARVSVKEKLQDGGGSYFSSPKPNIQFISSGSKLLDLALGGGWAEGRISNIVGDKSSGKTLCAIEASANFILKHPNGRVLYRECEAAFDPAYAKALGMPIDSVDFGEPIETIEELFADLLIAVKSKRPTLYIVDSLDALSDRSEMDRDMDQGSYGAEKAKKLSQLFRRLVRQMASANLTLMIISQVRSKIGVSFGRTTTRSGGRALDFYSSQTLFLAHTGTVTRTIGTVKRTTAIELKAKVDKNKVSIALREAQFKLVFSYGIDDLDSCVSWLKEVRGLDLINVHEKQWKEFIKETHALPQQEFAQTLARVHKATTNKWYEIERKFMPKRSKYAS